MWVGDVARQFLVVDSVDQFVLHTLLVYGGSVRSLKGLIATYVGYSGSMIASVPINASLVHLLQMQHSSAWAATLVLTVRCGFSVPLFANYGKGVCKLLATWVRARKAW